MNGACRFPAEWEPQAGLLVTWPDEYSDWAAVLPDIEAVYIDIARYCAEVQPIWIVCRNEDHATRVNEKLKPAAVKTENVRLIPVAYNDTWIRDYGPLAVFSHQQRQLLDFRFDGWGRRYPAELDDAVSTRLAATGLFGQAPLLRRSEVLEGGSLDTNGAGTIMTTVRCLLGASRNPGMQRSDWDRLFAEELGCDHVLWLQYGYLQGDDTDGHVDTLARFCSEDTIAHLSCDDPNDPNYYELQCMTEELQNLRRTDGSLYRLVPLPAPPAMRNVSGEHLPASYANFIIINERVLVPQYGEATDEIALSALRECFPARAVIGIDARAMVQQGGSLHCASMQVPKRQ